MLKLTSLLYENIDPNWINYLRKFTEITDGYNTTFDYIGQKDDTKIYISNLSEFGDMSLVITKAYIVAKLTEKDCMFGLVYVLNGLESLDATICRIIKKEEDGQISFEGILFDIDDKKNFPADQIKFKNVIR